ncbi:MAG: tRNA pseudouridine(38-40) synthase TruA [Ignavibacteria bacterium]|nr:tRNA pseudouridine(38-40) synthase TruA [Ignavibacteria bacterium]
MQKTIVFLIEYDGTNYSGWQRQKNSNSIQETIEKAIELVSGQKIFVIGAGRTDAGVHALGQVAHARIGNNFPIPEKKITSAINAVLPFDIRIIDAKIIDIPFHSTKDAIGREYAYLITTKNSVFMRNYSLYIPFEINETLLYESSKIFIGEFDFSAFAKKNPSTKNYVCAIEKSEWAKISDYHYIYFIKANRFVYGLVRSLVGIMLDVARGRRSLEQVKEALQKGEKNFPSPLAIPKGLFLTKVYYPKEKDFFQKNFDIKKIFLI